MIIDPAELEISRDAWFEKGQKAGDFNNVATQTEPRRVSMVSANDTRPGILGYNR